MHTAPSPAVAFVEEARAVLDAAGLPHAARGDLSRGERPGGPAREALAARLDHTLLKPEATAAAVLALVDEANAHGFASACVNPLWVATAASRARPPVAVCAVAGFPLGAGVAEAKAFEAARAVADGAAEVDMVVALGRLVAAVPPGAGERPDLDGLRAVSNDVAAVVRAVADGCGPVPAERRLVKVILETCLLTDRQKAFGALLALGAGAAFVKTSTGFSTGGATAGDVALLRLAAGERGGVKASGGIRDRAAALAMLAAGADRIGCSASIAIVAGG